MVYFVGGTAEMGDGKAGKSGYAAGIARDPAMPAVKGGLAELLADGFAVVLAGAGAFS